MLPIININYNCIRQVVTPNLKKREEREKNQYIYGGNNG